MQSPRPAQPASLALYSIFKTFQRATFQRAEQAAHQVRRIFLTFERESKSRNNENTTNDRHQLSVGIDVFCAHRWPTIAEIVSFKAIVVWANAAARVSRKTWDMQKPYDFLDAHSVSKWLKRARANSTGWCYLGKICVMIINIRQHITHGNIG